ncbi:MAG: NAD(+) synthase [Prevotella sp.]|nr:NAD(+) synthase [Prevotella sp.]
MQHGYIKVASAIPAVKVGDCFFNTEEIKRQMLEAEKQGVEIVVFPELSITGYTCQDLFTQQLLIQKAEEAVQQLLSDTAQLDIIAIIGIPVAVKNMLFNCAAVIQKGHLQGIVAKTYLPNYHEFYEKRWFASSKDIECEQITYAGDFVIISTQPSVFETTEGVKFGIEICEDLWSPNPPSTQLALAGADIVFNLSATNELIGKHQYLRSLLSQQSARTISAYIYSSCGFGESTQDVVYGGNALMYENGTLIAESQRFELTPQLITSQIDIFKLRAERQSNTTYALAQQGVEFISISCEERTAEPSPFVLERVINPLPFVPQHEDMVKSCEEIFNIQVSGLAQRLTHIHAQHAVIGISGGLDSTLALLVCVRTFDKLKLDRKGIVGVTMPGFGTTDRTYNNAIALMQGLGITIREINIGKSVLQHFEDIGHAKDVHNVVYENSQARERTQILMDISNQVNGIVVGTGDLSELALGWATYNGDHMSMYGVNAGIPKTLIRHLVNYVARHIMDSTTRQTLLDIVETPISPELIPADQEGNIVQKTEELVGPYELHDFFLYHFLRFGFTPSRLFLMAKQAFQTQQKGVQAYDDATIKHWLTTFIRRFFTQQFKRSCLPDGPKVGSVSLSPRGDWRMPSDATSKLWLDECSKL